MKYNFGILKNTMIGFKSIEADNVKIIYKGILKNVKQKSDNIYITFDNDFKLQIKENAFKKMLIQKDKDNIIWFVNDPDNTDIISSYVGFSLFDTYGFPIELTQEILREENLYIDIVGYEILMEKQKELSKGTFKNKDAFN